MSKAWRSCPAAVAVAIVILVMAVVTAGAGEAEEEIYIALEIPDRAALGEIAKAVAIDSLDQQQVLAYASPRGLRRLAKLGYSWQVLEHPGKNPGARMGLAAQVAIGQWDAYPTYAEYVAMMQGFVSDYPHLCQLYDIGDSSNAVRPHDLLVLRISDNPDQDEDEPEVFYTSTMHGDETVGYVLLLRLADELLSGYGSDPELTAMVDELEIWINPLANPDGTYYGGDDTVADAVRGLLDPDGHGTGVDPNRNFPDPDPDDGEHPDGFAWWQETMAMMDFAAASNFVLSANFHGGAEVVNYPWDTWARLHPDDDFFVALSRGYADQAQAACPGGYMTDLQNGITNGYAWYPLSGGRQDFFTYFHGSRETTIELSHRKNPSAATLPGFWQCNRQALLGYLRQALIGIRGIVTDPDGQALAATIEIPGRDNADDRSWVYCDPARGNYHRMLLPGTYTVRVTAWGHFSQEIADVTVAEGDATRLDLVLQPRPTLTVGGLVSTPDPNKVALGAATVEILDTPLPAVLTGSDGVYSIVGVPAGEYTFRVAAVGFETIELQRTIASDSSTQDFVLASIDTTFSSDFEASDGGLEGTGDWQWGPASGDPAALSGTSLWGTGLAGEYSNNGLSELDLRGIIVPSNNPRLSFWHFYDTEPGYDGGNVAIQSEGGDFEVLTPSGGYPSPFIRALFGPGYSDNGGDWQLATFDLADWAGETVTLRWIFASDQNTVARGWFIDDLAITGVTHAADFVAEPRLLPPGEPVQFRDRSSGSVTGWSWSFGDGATASIANPVHTYAAEGEYDVTLEVTYATGSASRTRLGYITTDPNVCQPTLTGPITRTWLASGEYQLVWPEANDDCGTGTISYDIYIRPADQPLPPGTPYRSGLTRPTVRLSGLTRDVEYTLTVAARDGQGQTSRLDTELLAVSR